jgi:hypothetical protein
MEPVPKDLAELAFKAKFPLPDEPLNPHSNTTIKASKARQIRVFLDGLVTYIETQLARCGKEPVDASPTP